MRSVIAYIATSLDLFIAREDGGLDWLFQSGEFGYHEFLDSVDTIVMGRKSYEQACVFEAVPFAGKKCIVFTRGKNKRKLKKFPHVEFVSENIPARMRALKKSKGKNIWVMGGGEIISLMLRENLLDELMLFVHPHILGKGIPLLPEKKEVKLKLLDSHAYPEGLVKLHYAILKEKE